MKKSLSIFTLLTCLIFMACSKQEAEKYEPTRLAAADDAMQVTINLKAILENAGCTVSDDGSIEYSKAVNTLLRQFPSEQRSLLENIAGTRGADFSDIFAKATTDSVLVLAWPLTDVKSFQQSLEDVWNVGQPETIGDFDAYALEGDATMFVGHEIAIIAAAGNRAMPDIESILSHCQELPLQDWQRDEIENKNEFNLLVDISAISYFSRVRLDYIFAQLQPIVGFVDFDAIKNGYAKVNGQLENNSVSIDLYALDADGKLIDTALAGCPTIDASLFKYAGKNDMLAIAAAFMPDIDWMSQFDAIAQQMGGYRRLGLDRSQVKMCAEVMADLDGTVLISAVPKNLTRLQDITAWEFTIVAEMKSGAAKKYLDLAYGKIEEINKQYRFFLGDDVIKCKYTGTSLDVNLSSQLSAYAKIDGKKLIISSNPISDSKANELLDPKYFSGNIAGAEATIDENSTLLQGIRLPFQPTIALTFDGSKLKLTFATDGDKPVLDAVLSFIAGQI